MPDVTVVIPNWNGSSYLADCVRSLERSRTTQTVRDILVVDNGSTDGSVELLRREFPQVRVRVHESNRGFAAACNAGARASQSEYVAFLNNDARVHDGWLEPLVETLDADPEVASVGSLVLTWDGARIDFGRAGLTPLARGLQLDYGKRRSAAPNEPAEQLFANGSAMVVRREVFLRVGGFDERFFAYYEDVDLGWRLWVNGWRVVLNPASIVYHRHHGTSRRLRPEQVQFLLTRNAIATAVKNTEDATFSRLIPILLLSEVVRLSESTASAGTLYVPGFEDFAFRDQSAATPLRRIRDQIGAGVIDVARGAPGLRRRAASYVRRIGRPRGGSVDRPDTAAAAALEEILWGWPELMASRARIQADRRRSDLEIAGLFRLDEQRRIPRSDALRPDATRAAVWRAMEAAGLNWLVPRG